MLCVRCAVGCRMPRKRLSMRKVREVLRLLWGQGRSAREVAKACGLARSSVGEYERRARGGGVVVAVAGVG